MRDKDLEKILRSALTLAILSPPILAMACGAGSESGPGDAPSATGTTPTDAPTSSTEPPGTIADSGADGAVCTNASLPAPGSSPQTCSEFYQLPCGLSATPGSLTAEQCESLCPQRNDSGPKYGCFVRKDTAGQPYVDCWYCAIIGRRPEGLIVDDRAGGAALGAFFADVSQLEAASVEAFRLLREDLAQHGAPKALSERADRAAQDEVRHAATTRSLARRFGAAPGAWSRAPRCASRQARSLEDVATENAVEGCVRETFGALVALHQAEHATDPHVREAMTEIAVDEARHAALAWSVASWVTELLDDDARLRVRAATRAAIAALEPSSELDDDLVTRGGLPNATAAKHLIDALDSLLWRA